MSDKGPSRGCVVIDDGLARAALLSVLEDNLAAWYSVTSGTGEPRTKMARRRGATVKLNYPSVHCLRMSF